MILPELSIIKLLCSNEQWCLHEEKIVVGDLPKELQPIYRVLQAHHNSTDGVDLSIADLTNLFFATSPADRDHYVKLFETLASLDVSEESTVELITAMNRNTTLRELSLAAYEVTQGRKEYSALSELFSQLDGLSSSESEEDEDEFVPTQLGLLIDQTFKSPGLRWRLNDLNTMMGSLRKGDFGFLFARPETGKTTFLASEATHFAEQLNADECGLWFNNEEEGKKVMIRVFQAVFGVPLEDLMANYDHYQAEYDRRIGTRLRMVDNSKITKTQIERICKKFNPRFIIFDQLDKVEGFADDRDDLRLGKIYIWARSMAKQYGPTIGVTQADGNGEGVRWLTMTHVANAKTAKQAEADWILGIGKDNNPGFEMVRFLHLSKNKLQGDPDTNNEMRHGKQQVLINPTIARYESL